MTLLDRLVDRTRRRRGLEIALATHALLDPSLVERIGPLLLSAEAIVLLNIILDDAEAARVALVPRVRIAVRFAYSVRFRTTSHVDHWERLLENEAVRPGEVLRLARDVARVTVQDLAAVGPFNLVLDLLAAEVSLGARAQAA